MTRDEDLDLSDPIDRMDLIEELVTARGPHKVAIKELKRGRTLRQNKAYWKLEVRPITRRLKELDAETPWTEMGVHIELLRRFAQADSRIVCDDGIEEGFAFIKGTSEMTTREMAEYYTRVQVWANRFLGMNIPDPDPEWFHNKVDEQYQEHAA